MTDAMSAWAAGENKQCRVGIADFDFVLSIIINL